MATSPIVEWRNSTSPFASIASLAITGSGYNGAIPVGTSSSVMTVRVYNNFVNTTGIADATNCVIACYDDTIHQGTAVNPETVGQYVGVSITDYNGTTTGGDTTFFQIGGSIKHPVAVNAGTIVGASSNYITVQIQVIIPQNAAQGSVTQGLWIEYSSTA